MAQEVSDTVQGTRIFGSDDNAAYMERLRPYHEKLLGQGMPLTGEEETSLKTLEAELMRGYTPQSLAESGILGKTGKVVGRNWLLKDMIWRMQLQDEERALSRRLSNASLPPDEKTAIYDRLEEMCCDLEPEHCSRSLSPG